MKIHHKSHTFWGFLAVTPRAGSLINSTIERSWIWFGMHVFL